MDPSDVVGYAELMALVQQSNAMTRSSWSSGDPTRMREFFRRHGVDTADLVRFVDEAAHHFVRSPAGTPQELVGAAIISGVELGLRIAGKT